MTRAPCPPQHSDPAHRHHDVGSYGIIWEADAPRVGRLRIQPDTRVRDLELPRNVTVAECEPTGRQHPACRRDGGGERCWMERGWDNVASTHIET